MSRIRDHYQEVDELLSSALPSTIAEAFRPNQITVRVEDDADHSFPQRGRGHSAPVIIVQKPFGSVSEVKSKRGNSRDRSRSRARSERIEPIDLAEDEPLLPASQEREEKREKRNSLALNVNFGVNIILLLAKGLAVLSSSSVSLVASFVDAFLDFISTLIIFVSNVAMGHKGDRHKYPAGKKRFEPLGVLIFSVTMIASFVQVSQQAARSPFAVLLNMTVCTGLYRVIPEGVGRAKRRRRGGRTQLVWYRVSRSFVFWYRPWLT